MKKLAKKQWLQYQDLSTQSIKKWRQATKNEKLSTCAAYLITLMNLPNAREYFNPWFNGVDTVKPFAEQMTMAIDISLGDSDFNDRQIHEFMLLAMIHLGYFNKELDQEAIVNRLATALKK